MYTQKVPYVPEFLIQAIDETGVVAESIFHVTKMIFAGEYTFFLRNLTMLKKSLTAL